MGEEATFKALLSEKRIVFTKDGNGLPRKKYYQSEREEEGQSASNWWAHDLFGHNQEGNDELTEIFNGTKNVFSNPKPTRLLKALCQIGNVKKGDIVLDFFAGSGSLADCFFKYQSDIKANFILVQMSEILEKSDRNQRVAVDLLESIGKPLSIAELSKERIRRSSIMHNGGGFKVLKLAESNFKQWQQIQNKDPQALEDQMKLFVDPVAENATIENMVYELMLKSGKDLNSKISHKIVTLSGAEAGFYAINENELILLLEKADQKIINNIIAEKPKKVVALDKLFKGNDQLKTNTVLQMKDAGIEFKTI